MIVFNVADGVLVDGVTDGVLVVDSVADGVLIRLYTMQMLFQYKITLWGVNTGSIRKESWSHVVRRGRRSSGSSFPLRASSLLRL